jgi:hypothetical protein
MKSVLCYEKETAQYIRIQPDSVLRVFPEHEFVDGHTERAWARFYVSRLRKQKDKQGGGGVLQVTHILDIARRYRCYARRNELTERREAKRIVDPLSADLVARLRQRPLNPVAFKYERAVGIEIECFGPSVEKHLPFWAREGTDGSVNYEGRRPDWSGREYRLLVKRSELEPRLYRVCQLLGQHAVNRSCGLHVHVDMRGKTENDALALAKHVDRWLYALREYVPMSRRENSYCQFGVSRHDRYRAVNLVALQKYKTLEIRLHSGTVSYEKIISWVRLVELLMAVKARPKGEGVAAMASLPLCEYERGYWAKRHQQINPEMYTAPQPATEQE